MHNEPARTVEFWWAGSNTGARAGAMARQAEEQGYDGITLGDTECQNPDAFIGLTVAAAATAKLQLGIGVTNPVTRHPAVLACAIATIQHYSRGRAVLGIGRGDSAVAKIGLPAATVDELEQYVARVKTYLAGRRVDADGPLARLTWIDELNVPMVPVDVAASGAGVIAAGARQADRLTLNVGADPERVRRCIEHAREARRAAHLLDDGISFGLYLNVAPHPDRAVALELVRPVVATYSRFSRSEARSGSLDAHDASVIRSVVDHYDISRHGRAGAPHLRYLDDDFVDRFAVAGTPEHCVDRLAQLFHLGLDRIAIVGPTQDADPAVIRESRLLLSEVVLPAVRTRLGDGS